MVIPSIASAASLCLSHSLDQLDPSCPLHLDIEDGNFIPHITFGLDTVRAIAERHPGPKDVHLFVTRPMEYLPRLAAMPLQSISFPIEAERYPLLMLQSIRALGRRAGVGLNLKTPVSELSMFLDAVDYVIIMTAEPDAHGCRFQPRACAKIRAAHALLPPEVEVWADGGLSADTLPMVIQAGAHHAVMGRAVFDSPTPRESIRVWNRLWAEDRNGQEKKKR